VHVSSRSFGQFEGVAYALDIVGERWSLLVVRELMWGPLRHRDLAENLPGIAPSVLAARLKELSDSGILHRRTAPPPVSAQVYELTGDGRALIPILLQLARWGALRLPFGRGRFIFRPEWAALAIRGALDLTAQGDGQHVWQVTVEDVEFTETCSEGTWTSTPGIAPEAQIDLRVQLDTITAHELLLGLPHEEPVRFDGPESERTLWMARHGITA
jgi:DNA-binding HxlR family transcriptional regulator